MLAIKIEPLVGIHIDTIGSIQLGASKKEVEALLKEPSSDSNTKQFYYDHYEVRIDFDAHDRVEFIEFIYGPNPKRTQLNVYGIDPFKLDADALITLLSEKNDGPIDDSEAKFAYAFFNLSVGIWRDSIEENVQESIDELTKSGEYEENKEWLLEDLEKSKHFWTIGIGVKDYYN